MSFGGGGKDSTLKQFVLGGSSGCLAAICTHPIDTVKVRMQLSGMGQSGGKLDGVFTTAYRVINTEGFMSLYKGLSASLLRQATYTTTRFGLYLTIKDAIAPPGGNVPLYQKILTSMLAGAGGAVVGSPADVVLVRMQADGKLPLDQRRNYKNAIDGLIRIAKNEGVLAMWKGSGPNMNRAMLMTAGQIASYDQFKQVMLQSGYFRDNPTTHFTASLAAAFVATVLCNPLDVIKTRIMNQRKGGDGVVYKNSVDCASQILKNEGPLGFYKGFVPFFARLGPQTILTFVFFEQLSAVWNYFGLK